PVVNGEVCADLENDIAKLALIDRHHGTGDVQVALVHGFGFTQSCAAASTVAHDSHHLLVVGTDEDNMAVAANILAQSGGGQVVVRDGKIIGKVDLPVGGLMSNLPAAQVARQVETVLQGFRECGCNLNNPNMQLSLLALVVIPELRISNQGLVDVSTFSHIPVLE
ncbi:MAG: adenine deaminase, partial [Longilinea sp.]|nr:adenine deaminase [Longilinea sp.]